MRLKSIELHLYKPLMHNGTRSIKVDDLPTVTVIAGENGSGKSSLLRECTPYPACRTDYDKNGLKKVVYEHNGSVYELTSDFSKSQGAHSFIKDGMELNESGTTEVQSDLVETYFEYNDVVEKLMSGKYKICDMGKPERKTLIMSTYPSSLSFMLDYYKVISSKLRALGANIKMLSQREMSLKSQLISPTILNDYKSERDDLNKALSVIDTDVYTINKGIDDVNKALQAVSYTILQQTPDSFIGKMKSIQHRLIGLTRAEGKLPEAKNVKIIIERLNNMRSALDNKIKEDNESARAMRTEIDQYEKYLNTDNDANIQECKNMIEVQDTIIKNTQIDESIPVISQTEVDNLKQNSEQIQAMLLNLKQSVTPFWSEEQYRNIEIQIATVQQAICTCNSNIARLDEDIKILEVKKVRYMKNTWPSDCKRTCPLRDSIADIVKNVDTQLDACKKEREKYSADRAKLLASFDELKSSLEQRTPDRQVLNELRKYFFSVSWSEYVLNGPDFTAALNSDITKIYNNITKLRDNSEKVLKVTEAKQLKIGLEAKLVRFENDSAPAEQLIRDALAKKEKQVQELIDRINENRAKALDIDKKNFNNNIYENLIAEAERVRSDYQIWKQTYTLQQEIKLYREFIDNLMQSRMKIQSKLRDLDSIIKEQDSYLIRLNDEVLVNLQEFQKQYDELAIIEAQLSPTKGIPHLYTVKYVNSIFSLANRFIARVWNYDMSLAYINEDDETFDYSFKLLLNGNSEIKDINMCSNGQRSIVNLAIRLAICIFRQYSTTYPIILDEISDGLSSSHSSSLVLFLSELLQQESQIEQVFIVDHNVSISSSFASIAKIICLSKDMDISSEWTSIGQIN